MAKKGKQGKKGKKGKSKDGPPPPPHGTIPWRADSGVKVVPLQAPARAGNFLLFEHCHTQRSGHSFADVSPITRSRAGGGSGGGAEPETVHLLCIANTETGLHVALPLPPSDAGRAAASRKMFFVRTPGSDWWVTGENAPVTVEPPPPSVSVSGGTGLRGPPVLVPWDERGSTPAQAALRSMPFAPQGASAAEGDDIISIPPGVAAALPTKQASRAVQGFASEAASLDVGWYTPMSGDPSGTEDGSAWALCWLGGASGMLEICLRDPNEDAAWRLTLSSQGGAAFCQGSRSMPPREFTSMTGMEVTRLSLEAVEKLSVDCVRALCRFGAWETVEGVMLDLLAAENARMAAKKQATEALAEGDTLPEGWGLSMWLPAADVMHEFLFELLRGEAPHPIVKLAADIAQIAAPHLVDFGPTGEGAPTLDMYLQQLKLPCVSCCGGWSLQTLHDMRGVVYLSVYHVSTHVHIMLRRDSEGEFDCCLPPSAADSQAAADGQQPKHRFLGDDPGQASAIGGSRCIGVRASGGRMVPTIQPDMRRARQEAERNRLSMLKQASGEDSIGQADSATATPATPTITLVPLPSARRATVDGSQRIKQDSSGRGFAAQLAAQAVSYFGNWIISLSSSKTDDNGGFESVVVRHIEHERSGFRLAASVVGSLTFIDSRVPPRTHLLASPPSWAVAATKRSSTAWINEWAEVSGGGGRARGGGHMGNLMAQTI